MEANDETRLECGRMKKRLARLPRVLRRWRMEKGLKQAAAAKNLGVSAATWGHWETGERFPSIENILALSDYTGIPIQQFFCPKAESCPFGETADAVAV